MHNQLGQDLQETEAQEKNAKEVIASISAQEKLPEVPVKSADAGQEKDNDILLLLFVLLFTCRLVARISQWDTDEIDRGWLWDEQQDDHVT